MSDNKHSKIEEFLFFIFCYGLSLSLYGLAFGSRYALLLSGITTIGFILKDSEIKLSTQIIKLPFIVLIGVVVSTIWGLFNLGGYEKLLQFNRLYGNSIPFELLIMYIPLFFVSVYYLKNEKYMFRFINLLLITGFVVLLMVRFNILSTLGGYTTSSSVIEESSSVSVEIVQKGSLFYVRETFGSLDTNIYAQVLSFLMVIAVYSFISAKGIISKLLSGSVLLLAFFSIIKTASQSGLIQTIIGIGLFIWIAKYSNKKLVKRIFIVFFIFSILSVFFIELDSLVMIKSRISISYDIIKAILLGDLSFGSYDTFTFRIFAAILAFDEIENLLFGTGGYRLGIVWGTGNHIDFINWLTQYGLISFLPLMLFLFYLLKSNIIILKELLPIEVDKKYYNLSALGITIVAVQFTAMLVNPMGRYTFFWVSISAGAYFINNRFINRCKYEEK